MFELKQRFSLSSWMIDKFTKKDKIPDDIMDPLITDQNVSFTIAVTKSDNGGIECLLIPSRGTISDLSIEDKLEIDKTVRVLLGLGLL